MVFTIFVLLTIKEPYNVLEYIILFAILGFIPLAWYYLIKGVNWLFDDSKSPSPISPEIQTGQNKLSEEELTKPESTVKIREEPFTPEDEKLFEEFKEKHKFVAHSHAMLTVFKQIKKAAKTKITVIITGESGTGKELVAKAIHDESNRKNEPFISRHCGAIPKNLIDVTLFGCIAGFITGVPEAKDGLFTAADGGTLFLDEFGDLAQETQDKLLKVLEYGKITIGGKQTEDDVNVKVIVATNKNLKKLIDDGDLREDLHFRVNNYPIQLPPISERKNEPECLSGRWQPVTGAAIYAGGGYPQRHAPRLFNGG